MHLRTYFWAVSAFFRSPLFATIALAWACNSSCENHGQTAAEKDPVKLEYSQVETTEQFGDRCAEPGAACMELKLNYPKINSNDDSIASILKDSVDRMLLAPVLGEKQYSSEEEMKNAIDLAYRQYKEDFPEVESKWYVDRTVQVVSQWEGVVCISYFESSYLGGAHPNTMTFFKNYSLKTGKRVFLESWFNSEERELIRKYAEKVFREKNGLEHEASLAEAGYWFTNDQFSLTDNYKISEEGITFLFNPYEIAPYSFGSKDVFVPSSAYKSI